MKKIIVFLIVCFFITPIAKAEKHPFGNGLYWELGNEVLVVSGNGSMPDRIRPWENAGIITKVVIENGVTSIGEESFYEFWCKTHTLTFVEMSNSIKTIGKNAFCKCENLSHITFSNSLEDIGEGAFWGCESLVSISLPNSVKNISDDAFLACTKLSSIMIPVSVTSIGEGAFAECPNLKSISVPNTVTSIGDNAFIGDEDDECYTGVINSLPQWLLGKGSDEWKRCGLSESSVNTYKRNNSPSILIKRSGGYVSVVEVTNGHTKYYIVDKSNRYG